MKILRTGFILNTEKYEECVRFYQELFNLRVLYQEEDGIFKLTCFEFGGSYLMIETGGKANPIGKSISENAAKIRFNVSNIDGALEHIKAYGISAQVQRNNWGNSINIYDPDGNRIGIRDEETFSKQLGTVV